VDPFDALEPLRQGGRDHFGALAAAAAHGVALRPRPRQRLRQRRLFRPRSRSSGYRRHRRFTWTTSIPVPGDYDGDGKTDVARYDPTSRVVWICRSTTGSTTSVSMADVTGPGAIPVLKKPQ
jgi:hypothetical protein